MYEAGPQVYLPSCSNDREADGEGNSEVDAGNWLNAVEKVTPAAVVSGLANLIRW